MGQGKYLGMTVGLNVDYLRSIAGLMDYEAALRIDPHNEQLKKDTARIREEVLSEKKPEIMA